MNWPTTIMAPALGVVAAAVAGFAMRSFHQAMPATVMVALVAGLAVGGFFRIFGRRTDT